MPLPAVSLKGRVALVTGGSRGIGRECCLALARAGCAVVVAAKSTEPKPNLPGSIFTVAEEVRALGGRALPVKLDVRDEKSVDACVKATVAEFGRLDILVNNASTLWWHSIEDTPVKKMTLMFEVNARGTFACTKACLPHMVKGGFGRVITMSPPIRLDSMAGHTAYNVTKHGMTYVAMGVAQEYEGKNITGNALWPATVIESQASINFKLGNRSMWRKADILADAVVQICGSKINGCTLIDDTYLKSRGMTDEELKRYRCDPEVEPPRLLDSSSEAFIMTKEHTSLFTRGDVRKVDADAGTRIASKL